MKQFSRKNTSTTTKNPYIRLLKPGIIKSNTIAALAGYLFASGTDINFGAFLGLLVGMALIIASACVYNNYFDREMDLKMARTKNRPLATGELSAEKALLFAFAMLLLGIGSMYWLTNMQALSFALVGFFVYVFIYTPLKKRSVHGTLVGAVSGSMPPVAGYVAFTNSLDKAALLLAVIWGCWQMAHFFSIALYRFDDYKRTDTPVLPVAKGANRAKAQTVFYIVALTVSTALLTVFGYTGWSFLVLTGLLNLAWLRKSQEGYNTASTAQWGKQVFLFSLIVMSALSILVALGKVLP